MNELELWRYFEDKKSAVSRPFDRDFIWVPKKVFELVKEEFIEEVSIFHNGASFRSRAYFSHIHAVIQGEFVFIHMDTGNLARFLPLGLLHFVFDLLPYIAFAIFKRKPLKSIFERPG